jgi:hypothetical protein
MLLWLRKCRIIDDWVYVSAIRFKTKLQTGIHITQKRL